jgi:DNA repair exonuclease SbcCD nuclease subunit
MSKVAFLGDIHIGCRQDSQIFAEHHIRFFEEQFIPYLLKNKINRIVQFGDIFDRRKFVNFQILDMWKRRVFDVLRENQIEVNIIVGNHDVAYKNTNDVNSPILLLSEYENIFVYTEPTEVMFDDTMALLVPWINSSNEKEVAQAVKKTKAQLCFGHFEFAGFQMDKGYTVESGLDVSHYKKFSEVYSGHYHHRSNDGHVFYLGIPYQMTWVDYGSKKGFHIWDTKSMKLTWIHNPNEIFVKLTYNDSHNPEDHWRGFDTSNLAGKYIKIIVVNKKNLFGFDQLMSRIYASSPADVKIIENMIDTDVDEIEEDLNLDDTSVVLEKYIEALDTGLNKDKLKHMMKQLYVEAMHEGTL